MTRTADIDTEVAAILSAILVIGCRTKPVFEIDREVTNQYMKFGRNQIKMTELE